MPLIWIASVLPAQGLPVRHAVATPTPAAIPACPRVEPGMSCDAIQARNSNTQVTIGWLQAGGLVASLLFSAGAAWAAVQAARHSAVGARASVETLNETSRMNAATVRPHVSIESALINFNQQPPRPMIMLGVRNASQFTAHDWEWQAHLHVTAAGGDAREIALRPWGPRGVRGRDIPPPDVQEMTPATIGFELDQAEMAALSALRPEEGLRIFLTVASRCFDIFDNPIEDYQHFAAIAFNAMARGGGVYHLVPSPPGTRIEGQEIRVPAGATG
ncbi:MAG: hypothetical protein KGM17_06405 [Sphingomonadales bacterium]|nr:hypothetical protein [Sphingomonadales bacterium]